MQLPIEVRMIISGHCSRESGLLVGGDYFESSHCSTFMDQSLNINTSTSSGLPH